MNLAPHTPTVSVVIPVFNAERTIAETVASVLAQDFADFELILIDDGSRDESLWIMLGLAASDDRIRLVSRANGGVSTARNDGVAMSRGRLVAFCDADDVWYPCKLSAHVCAHAERPMLAASYGQIRFVEDGDCDARRGRTLSTVPRGKLEVAQIIAENPVCTASNLVVSRAAFDRIGAFDTAMSFSEDQEWLARAARNGESVRGIDRLLVDYRLSPTGLSVNLARMYEGWLRLVELHGEGIDLAPAEAIYCRYLARRALRSGNAPSEALQYVRKGLVRSHRAFLSDTRRGGATLAAAIAAPLIPGAMRRRLFA